MVKIANFNFFLYCYIPISLSLYPNRCNGDKSASLKYYRSEEGRYKICDNIKEFVRSLPIIDDSGKWLKNFGDAIGKAIEAYYNDTFTKKKVGRWVTELKKVYNRGFTPGFYFKRMTEEDHQHKSPTNLSHYRYIRVGQIEKYDKNTGFATISLDNGYLSLNDDIIVMGKATNTYIHQIVEKLKFKENVVKKTPRGTNDNKTIIDLGVNDRVIENGLDKVYVFTDKTYQKKKYSL